MQGADIQDEKTILSKAKRTHIAQAIALDLLTKNNGKPYVLRFLFR